ncbi:tRNA-splicing endonuclease positive effector [Hyphodiscus hymeniophilus]|uniref:tRNA-splicing endonuclease positive effector n=1 Tax=Hyphodiscus hymeniophilus TaxID=353542 RepID=A0A9P7B012_9HELO|nr:tRNA-splicing endonuclease positive effector [Hyphodiscus hymeniophilus]
MREENEIMDELQGLDGELKSFPPDAHWFCPRRNDEDHIDYDHPFEPEEDMSPETKLELIQDAKRRHDVAYKYSLIFGLSPDVSGVLSKDYAQRLDLLLTTCDKCIRNWHIGRKPYLKDLFSHRLDAIDFERLDAGLKTAGEILDQAEPNERSQALIAKHDSRALLALFEALCCVDYHKSDEQLAKYFNNVFEKVQNRKILRIGDTLPAMARFLFSKDFYRTRFATNAWQKMLEPLTPKIFDWVVHDALTDAIVSLSQPNTSISEIRRFWDGFLVMLDSMDEEIITHSLRAMEVQPNIYFLALSHLASSSEEIVGLAIEAIRRLLTKSPKNFWSAFATISPTVIAEQIFASPAFDKLLEKSQDFEHPELSPVTNWIPEFLSSLQSVHQLDACRTLLYNLLERLQISQFSGNARMSCCRAGLNALSTTLQTFIKSDYKINPSTSLIVIGDIMGLVNTYKSTITGCAGLRADNDKRQLELKRLGMLVIRDVLALDCKTLNAEYFALEAGAKIQRGLKSHSQSIWEAVLDIFFPGDFDLAKSILAATSSLIGLDELRPVSRKSRLPEDHAHYNKAFKQLNGNVAKVFQRLSDFEPSDLRKMYETPQIARPMFAGLLSAEQDIYEASVGVIKTMTGETDQDDAIKRLLEQAFSPTMNSLTYAVTKIKHACTFTPVIYLLSIGKRVLEALCGNTGVLRTRTSLSASEQSAVMAWWSVQWRAMDVVFSNLEPWAMRVDKPTTFLQDFCRDAMEYAESLFDKHSVLATALRESSPSENDSGSLKASSKASITKVLDVICQNVNGLTMLVRLRDAYLVDQVTNLLSKLLRSLGEYDLEITTFALDYITDACQGVKKTNLTMQQRAELQRTLDEHQGFEYSEMPFHPAPKKQSTIDSWSKSADGVKHEPSFARGSLPVAVSAKTLTLQEKNRLEVLKAEQDRQQFKDRRRQAEDDRKRANAEAVAKAKALRGATVRGEGSGLKDIGGVMGKDHAPARSEIMVGSSDEDSDSDSDEDETNALVKTRKATSKKVAEYEESRRRALLKQQQGPVKKTKIQRSAKDMRARVEPNMDRLYLEILNWDIFHEGDKPPSKMECVRIEDRFQELDRYKDTFTPLLISEVWRSLVTAKDESNFKPIEIKVLNRLSVDKFMEVSTNMPMPAKRSDLKISERDIVLLSKSNDPLNNPQEPHCLARVERTTRKKDVVEVTYKISREVTPDFLQVLCPNGKIHAVKIADMTTTQREYAALSSLEYYDLCDEVLEAKPSPIQKYGGDRVSQTSPGSGKTKTIIAMVGTLLTRILQEQRQQQAQARPHINHAPGGAKPAAPVPKKKLLICAPSNAAVDELVVRLKEGVQPLDGASQKINVIRIGRSDAINADVKDVMLDELVRQKLEGTDGEKNKLFQDRDKLHQEAGRVKDRLNEIRPQMDAARATNDKSSEQQLQREFDTLKRTQGQIGAKIDADKQSGNTVSRQNEINRRQFQQQIIDGAHVLCATLSGSGHDMFKNLNVEFETVIIDEAAQCIELSALIPLKYGCSKCILVGDPEQLPPTVLSRAAQSYGYEQSLFVRMQRNHPKDVHLLDTQYRMHPEISAFPSQQFYHSRLVDGPNMAQARDKPWHVSSILGPYRFFDVEGVQTKEARGHSFINVPEMNAAMALYRRLKADYGGYDFKGKIGIITTYKAQLIELKSRFARQYGDQIFEEIEFNTTDAFQGREREIIIFSCVRAKATGGIGFLGDIRRMNVGLTRAKSSLWVLGDSRSLQQGQFWNRLIEDAKARDKYTGGDVMGLFSRPTTRDRKVAPRVNGNVASSVVSRQSATIPSPKSENDDVVMIDPPSTSTSRKSSGVSTNPPSANLNGARPVVKREPQSLLGIKKESSKKSSTRDLNEHGKRSRETSAIEEGEPPKKIIPPGKAGNVDLSAALAAREAALKAAPPTRPVGVAPPRRKPPADPFIARKPKPKRQ